MTNHAKRAIASKRTSFRLREDAFDLLAKRAAEAGLSNRAWLEEAILNNQTKIIERKKTSDDVRTLVVQINRIGNNLNQIAHNLNTASLTGKLSPADCGEALDKLDHLRALLNEALIHARKD